MPQSSRERRQARSREQDVEDGVEERTEDARGGSGAISELRGVMSEAAVTVLAPVAKRLATKAAKMAVERGPELLEDTVLPKLQDVGSKFGGGGDDGKGKRGSASGTGKGRRMPIQQAVDVAAPLEVVYDQWTQFEDYPKFMHRVERVEQRDEAHVVFHEKVWGIRRAWEAEIVEQKPDERIVWETVSGMHHVGVVTFHELSDRLTRVELNIDIDPDGPVEKIARGARFAKRAARADLKRFKAFVEMRDEETGAWRGAIEDGDVVDSDDYEAEEEEPEEPESYEEEDYEDEEPESDEEDEEDEQPSRRAGAKSKGNGGRAKSSSSSSSRGRTSAKSRSGSGNGRRKSRAKASSGKRSS